VTQEHLDARRRQILDAAARCFARNGFHATSMNDILAAARLSNGAVYRYFRGKDEIIIALSSRVADRMVERLGRIAAQDPPPSIARLIDAMHEGEQDMDSALLVQIWAEAARNPAVEQIMRRHGERMRDTIRSVLMSRAPGQSADVVEGFVALSAGVFLSQTRFAGDACTEHLTDAVRVLLSNEPA
jgi:AcrR family transcriptional regulator